MAALPTTGLETHPAGTAGLNGIISANWETLEAIFAPIAAGDADSHIGWDSGSKIFTIRASQAALAYSATPAVSFTGAKTQVLALTGNAVLSSANLAAGRKTELVIQADGTLRTLGFPAGWVFVGAAAPANIAASKTGLLELHSTTGADAGVVARWTVQA